MSDDQLLRQLNEQYIGAFMTSDVAWYDAHLTEDFVCIESDGSVLNKADFLRQTASGTTIADYHLQQVNVRQYGDVALVQATGIWRAKNGMPGLSRYTDVYVRGAAGWRVVSAQITRPPAA